MAQLPACTILLVDDEPHFCRALAALLRRQGYTVATAANGARAWEHLHAQPYDVILCDIVMPEVNGLAFFTLLHQYAPALCARVIFLTGDIVGATTTAFLHHCGQPWLYKPCGVADVLRAIEQVLCAPARLGS